MDEYEKYLAACEEIKGENSLLLAEFGRRMESEGLAPKTIAKHLSNMTFFLNRFLLYEAPLKAQQGVNRVDEFLGHWFIRKAPWASKTAIRDYIAVLQRFYAFLHTKGLVSAEALRELKAEIKRNRREWLDTPGRFEEPNIDF
jgi:hypothetical protein